MPISINTPNTSNAGADKLVKTRRKVKLWRPSLVIVVLISLTREYAFTYFPQNLPNLWAIYTSCSLRPIHIKHNGNEIKGVTSDLVKMNAV